MKQAIFLTGGPGSGKDLLIKEVFQHNNYIELNIDQIKEKKFYTENIVVVSNAFNLDKIQKAKDILENCYYNTSLVFVDVSDKVSRERLVNRNLNEEVRKNKLEVSRQNLEEFVTIFENCYYFDNNFKPASNEIYEQLVWINEEIESLSESKLEKFKKKIKKKNSESSYNPLPFPSDGINSTYDTRAAGNGDLIRNYQYESLDPQPLEQGIGMGSNHGNQSNQEPMLSLKDSSHDKTEQKPKIFGRIKKILGNKNA